MEVVLELLSNQLSLGFAILLLIINIFLNHKLKLKYELRVMEREEKRKIYSQFIISLDSLKKGTDGLSEEEKKEFEKLFAYMNLISDADTVDKIYRYVEFFSAGNLSEHDLIYTELINCIRRDYSEEKPRFFLKKKYRTDIKKAYKIGL